MKKQKYTIRDFPVGQAVMVNPGVGLSPLPDVDNVEFSVVAHRYDNDDGVPTGWVKMYWPLRGRMDWEITSIRPVEPTKVWNKAYRKGLVAGKHLKTRKKKNAE